MDMDIDLDFQFSLTNFYLLETPDRQQAQSFPWLPYEFSHIIFICFFITIKLQFIECLLCVRSFPDTILY